MQVCRVQNEQKATRVPGYERGWVPPLFDTLIATMFAPFGGVRRLREATLERMRLQPGMRVLEPGCGTGGITRLLLARGAQVTAVDGSAPMLARARSRAPQATFLQQRLEALTVPAASFERVLFAFVLHELPPSARAAALAHACAALAPGGELFVLDHAVPAEAGFGALWRGFLLRLEPPSVADIITRGVDAELAATGLEVHECVPLAGGTARLWLARAPLRFR